MSEQTAAKTAEEIPEKVKAKKKAEPTMRVKFMNNEGGTTAPLDFVYQGKAYHLAPGKEYDLPLDVVNHLNSLSYPIYEDREDEHGNMRSVKVGTMNRFTCHPVGKFAQA